MRLNHVESVPTLPLFLSCLFGCLPTCLPPSHPPTHPPSLPPSLPPPSLPPSLPPPPPFLSNLPSLLFSLASAVLSSVPPCPFPPSFSLQWSFWPGQQARKGGLAADRSSPAGLDRAYSRPVKGAQPFSASRTGQLPFFGKAASLFPGPDGSVFPCLRLRARGPGGAPGKPQRGLGLGARHDFSEIIFGALFRRSLEIFGDLRRSSRRRRPACRAEPGRGAQGRPSP